MSENEGRDSKGLLHIARRVLFLLGVVRDIGGVEMILKLGEKSLELAWFAESGVSNGK